MQEGSWLGIAAAIMAVVVIRYMLDPKGGADAMVKSTCDHKNGTTKHPNPTQLGAPQAADRTGSSTPQVGMVGETTDPGPEVAQPGTPEAADCSGSSAPQEGMEGETTVTDPGPRTDAVDLTREGIGVDVLVTHRTPAGGSVSIAAGSVVDFTGDAIVNAANEGGVGGGGVDGAINTAGGPVLVVARQALPVLEHDRYFRETRIPTGEARITVAGNINVKQYVRGTTGAPPHLFRETESKYDCVTRKCARTPVHAAAPATHAAAVWTVQLETSAPLSNSHLALASPPQCHPCCGSGILLRPVRLPGAGRPAQIRVHVVARPGAGARAQDGRLCADIGRDICGRSRQACRAADGVRGRLCVGGPAACRAGGVGSRGASHATADSQGSVIWGRTVLQQIAHASPGDCIWTARWIPRNVTRPGGVVCPHTLNTPPQVY